jgi:hypothetical protein
MTEQENSNRGAVATWVALGLALIIPATVLLGFMRGLTSAWREKESSVRGGGGLLAELEARSRVDMQAGAPPTNAAPLAAAQAPASLEAPPAVEVLLAAEAPVPLEPDTAPVSQIPTVIRPVERGAVVTLETVAPSEVSRSIEYTANDAAYIPAWQQEGSSESRDHSTPPLLNRAPRNSANLQALKARQPDPAAIILTIAITGVAGFFYGLYGAIGVVGFFYVSASLLIWRGQLLQLVFSKQFALMILAICAIVIARPEGDAERLDILSADIHPYSAVYIESPDAAVSDSAVFEDDVSGDAAGRSVTTREADDAGPRPAINLALSTVSFMQRSPDPSAAVDVWATHYGESYEGQRFGCPGITLPAGSDAFYHSADPNILAVSVDQNEEWRCGDKFEICGLTRCIRVYRVDSCNCAPRVINLSEAGSLRVCGVIATCTVTIKEIQ